MSTTKFNIKKTLLDGYSAQEIVEAIHVGTVYEKNTPLGILNRPELNKSIRDQRYLRETGRLRGGPITDNRSISNSDLSKIANFHDNQARVKSQTSNPKANLLIGQSLNKAATQQPRLYQAAKK